MLVAHITPERRLGDGRPKTALGTNKVVNSQGTTFEKE
jgi:hypothetical protein